jgi:hypothetical protein
MFNERYSKFIHITRGMKKVISPLVMLNINMLVKARKLKKGVGFGRKTFTFKPYIGKESF